MAGMMNAVSHLVRHPDENEKYVRIATEFQKRYPRIFVDSVLRVVPDTMSMGDREKNLKEFKGLVNKISEQNRDVIMEKATGIARRVADSGAEGKRELMAIVWKAVGVNGASFLPDMIDIARCVDPDFSSDFWRERRDTESLRLNSATSEDYDAFCDNNRRAGEYVQQTHFLLEIGVMDPEQLKSFLKDKFRAEGVPREALLVYARVLAHKKCRDLCPEIMGLSHLPKIVKFRLMDIHDASRNV